MNFYTNVLQYGGKILIRGIKDGKSFAKRINYKPSFFIKSKKDNTTFTTLQDEPVEEIQLPSIDKARNLLKQYKNSSNVKLYGMDRFLYQFISDEYKDDIEWNKDFDGSKQDFIDYAEAKGFKSKDAGSIYETQHTENEQWQYGGELKADEDFGQFTIQNPDLSTDKYPIDQEGFGRASWEDAEIDHRKRWLIKNGFDSNAEDNAYLPYYSLPSMVRAVLAKDLHVGGIQAMGESKASELATTIEDMKYDNEPMRSGDGRGILGDPLYPESTKKGEPKLDTEEEIDDYIKNGKEDEDKDPVGASALGAMAKGYKTPAQKLKDKRESWMPVDEKRLNQKKGKNKKDYRDDNLKKRINYGQRSFI